MPKADRSAGSQSRFARFISWVREALVTSVTCCPVRFHSTHVSMVPNSSSRFPRSGTLSSNQRSFRAEK